MSKFSISEYLMAFRDSDGNGLPCGDTGYKSTYPVAPRIICVDGFSISVQATQGAYCSPRRNIGPWYEVECGFPSAVPEFIGYKAEDPQAPTETVYPYTDIDLVERLIESHGGPNEKTIESMKNPAGAMK